MSDTDYPKGTNPKRPMYQRKGWKGQVDKNMNANYCEHYDDVNWGEGTKKPKKKEQKGIATIYTF